MIRLYNSLGREVQEFMPLKPGEVSLYTCGPTVYDYPHIGNLRKFIFDDTLRRMLVSQGLVVDHVMNITDVGHLVSDADEGEDKLEKGASRTGKTVWDVAQFYLDAFNVDMRELGNVPATKLVRATDAIDAQTSMISTLLEKEYAYITPEAIYFDVTKLADYGKLSGQSLEEKQVGVRDEVVTETSKQHPQDFALWFFTVGHFADHQMHWASPWRDDLPDGFPGWHLECSAIIEQKLGETIDIHTGGVDHIGTHHTNEIAQSEAAHDAPLAQVWMHSQFLRVDDAKMSKSLGNFYTLNDLTGKNFSPLSFRLMMLQAHYRSELNFTFSGLRAAQNRLLDMYAWAVLQHDDRDVPAATYNVAAIDAKLEEIKAALADDLATPKAMSILSGLMDSVVAVPKECKEHFVSVLHALDELFALGLASQPDIDLETKSRITERQQAKDAGDFKTSDAIRAELLKENIELSDTPLGARWRRKAL